MYSDIIYIFLLLMLLLFPEFENTEIRWWQNYLSIRIWTLYVIFKKLHYLLPKVFINVFPNLSLNFLASMPSIAAATRFKDLLKQKKNWSPTNQYQFELSNYWQ